MSNTEEEHLTLCGPHFIVQNAGSETKKSYLQSGSVFEPPPFAPHPGYVQNTSSNHSVSQSQVKSRSSSAQPPIVHPHISSNECNIHEFCYYFQRVIFMSAIATGIGLVVTGAVMHALKRELLVFVYIGTLLVCVNTGLLMIQFCVRRKQERRTKALLSGPKTSKPNTTVHYNPINRGAHSGSQGHGINTAHIAADQRKQYHPLMQTVCAAPPYPNYLGHRTPDSVPDTNQRFFTPEYSVVSAKTESVTSHHRHHTKESYPKSPLPRQHLTHQDPLDATRHIPARLENPQPGILSSQACYNDLIQCAPWSQEGTTTTIHLI